MKKYLLSIGLLLIVALTFYYGLRRGTTAALVSKPLARELEGAKATQGGQLSTPLGVRIASENSLNWAEYSKPPGVYHCISSASADLVRTLGVDVTEFETLLNEVRHDMIKKLLPYTKITESIPGRVVVVVDAPQALTTELEKAANASVVGRLGFSTIDQLTGKYPELVREIDSSMLNYGAFKPELAFEVEKKSIRTAEGQSFPLIRYECSYMQGRDGGYTNQTWGRVIGDLNLVEAKFEIAALALRELKKSYPNDSNVVGYVPDN